MIVSAMQPYFYPYMNYFKLIEKSNFFVILDDVQFPRRGWVHRNKLRNKHDRSLSDWITLPLIKKSQNTLIKELEFDKNKIKSFINKSQKFEFFEKKIDLYPQIKKNIYNFNLCPLNYLVNHIKIACNILQIKTKIKLSSELKISKTLGYQERMIKIVEHFKGDTYLNLPGGKKLYDKKLFKENGINLIFLDIQYDEKPSFLDFIK